MHKEMIKVIFDRFNSEDKVFLEKKFCKMLECIKEYDKEKYYKIKNKIYVHLYGEHLNEEMAETWVSYMKNKDNSIGGHWSLSETTDVAKKYGVEFRDFNEYEWYAIMNMIYSNYYGSVSNEISVYVDLAKNWFHDKNADSGKTYRYFANVVKMK